MLKPTGFWSYTTSDETNARGKLSQLRALLAAELQQQVGREPIVNIFQDVAAIPPGQEWETQISNAIAESSFIIPVITPGFLQSEWCCREVSLFQERELKIGSKSLIFPIHYVDVSHVDNDLTRDCHDPAILSFLRTRQWIDFRSLRLRNQDGEDVAIFLERLARSVFKALREAAVEHHHAQAKTLQGDAVEARPILSQYPSGDEPSSTDDPAYERRSMESKPVDDLQHGVSIPRRRLRFVRISAFCFILAIFASISFGVYVALESIKTTMHPHTPSISSKEFDSAEIPFVCDVCRSSISVAFSGPPNNVLALATDGNYAYGTHKSTIKEAEETALADCARQTSRLCKIYAVNDMVTWPGPWPPMPPEPWVTGDVSFPFDAKRIKGISEYSQNQLANEYPAARGWKALAVGPNGAWSFVAHISSSLHDVERRALAQCGMYAGSPCKIIVVNTNFVVDPNAPSDPTP